MVEFALVVPVLLVLVLGIINFAYLFGQKLALNQAVREGARASVVPSSGALSPATNVTNAAGPLLTGTINTSVSGSCASAGVGNNLTVTSTYVTAPIVPMPVPGFPSSFTLSARSVFRCEF